MAYPAVLWLPVLRLVEDLIALGDSSSTFILLMEEILHQLIGGLSHYF